MKTTWQVMLALAVAAGFTAFAKTNSSDTVTLKGTVLDATGRPVEGASVEVSTPPAATRRFSDPDLKVIERAVTGSNGVFEVALPRNNAFVTARKTGFAPAWLQFWNLQADTERRLVLMPPACLAGVVVDETDKPLAGAEVFVHVGFSDTPQAEGQSGYGYLSGKLARELFNARTGPDGRFRIENFPTNASASLLAQASGKTLREPALPTSWGPDSMPWQAGQQNIRLVVEPAGSVEGTLVVEGGTAPLPIAQLFLQPDAPGVFNFGAREPVTSGADGVFRIPDVPPGSHRLHALFDTNAVPEGVAETFPDWVAEPVPVSVESGQTTRDVRVKAIRGGVLLVNVLSKTDRKPRAQAGVSAYRESHQVATASDSNGVALL
ncbi:MAG TPA: carboxypeptidase-like regulatory domain-containing protein, partial [Verrucomicrobiae bacterium]